VKVFLDTNVLVSAFATRGLAADLFELLMIEHELLTGRGVLDELDRALHSKLKLPPARRAELLEFVSSEAAMVIETAAPVDVGADQDDRRVLGEAVAAGAEAFVTGDAALVRLKSVGTMQIVTPRQLWELLRTDEQAGR
jgi:putative PIN family toxin of toxin-antitoxin system